MKNVLLLSLIGLILIIGIFIVQKGKNPGNEEIILFYGDNCPRCTEVEKYVKENNIEEKIKFEKKEVFNNKDNAGLLAAKAKICGLSSETIAVPFLWTGSECFIGYKDVINFFDRKTK